MTTMTTTIAPAHPPMSSTRKAALAGGLLYLATFIFSIPALAFYDGVLHDPGYVHGAGSAGGVLWGGVFEMITALTGIGTAVVLYPIIRRHGRTGAIGFVASRTLEAATIVVGVIAILSIYSLRQDFAGTDAPGLTVAASSLLALHNWSFLLGPGVMPAINALCLATVLYRSRLVPRLIPAIGFIGGPLLLASTLATLFGAYAQVSSAAMLTAIPIATWEFSLGVWLTFKGFRNVAAGDEPPVAHRVADGERVPV
jgi:hypothetical protein